MPRWLPERWRGALACGIDHAGIAWRCGGEVHAVPHGEHAQGLWAGMKPGDALTLVASPGVARHWLQAPAQGVRSLAELQAVAMSRCLHLHGGEPDDWWLMGDWRLDRSFACVAFSRERLGPLLAAATQRRLRLQCQSALVLAIGSRWAVRAGAGHWMALRMPGHVGLWQGGPTHLGSLLQFDATGATHEDVVVRARTLSRLHTQQIDTGVSFTWLELHHHPSDAHAALGLLQTLERTAGKTPAALQTLTARDGLRPNLGRILVGADPHPATTAAALALSASAIAAGTAAWKAASGADVPHDLRGAQMQPQPRLTPVPALKAEDRKAWAAVAGQLNLPWDELLAAIESATTDDVAILALEPDPAAARVRVLAEAKDASVLLAYALRLEQAGLPVRPLRHETHEQDTQRPVRLTLDLVWPAELRSSPRKPGKPS